MTALLEVREVEVWYADLQALFGVSIDVDAGEAVALIGANGAGKSTLLRAIAGLSPLRSGEIRLGGARLGTLAAERIAQAGIALVPEGRRLFASLTVEENLLMGGVAGRRGDWDIPRVLDLLPALRDLRRRPPTQLSGGEQQMIAIGRALMANPRVLLCDEVSLGLAPAVIEQIYRAITQIRAGGVAVVLVEQDVARARAAADRIYCLRHGQVTLAGRSGDYSRERVSSAYFGH